MADKDYTIQLADGRQLSISQQNIPHYPTINDTIDSSLFDPEQAILLPYDDPEALYKVFTTPFQQQNHTLDMYVRLANAIDFLANDDVLNQMMAALVEMFNDPNLVVQFKTNKENIKEILRNLNNGPQHWLLYNTINPRLDYRIDHEVDTYRYGRAVSNDLSYVVIWIPPRVLRPGVVLHPGQRGLQRLTIYKDGQEIKDVQNPPQFPAVSGKLVIDDNGTIYSVDDVSNIYVWPQPDYIPQLYKHIGGEPIELSDDTQRYLQKVEIGTSYTVAELATGNVLSQVISYDAPPAASPHMDILSVKYFIQNKYNHAIWVVDNNTNSWIELPKSEVLLLSNSEKIIATTSSQPQANGTYGVAIYKRRGINFVSPANTEDVVGQPVAVSEKYLLTKQGARGHIINVHRNIAGQINIPIYTLSMEQARQLLRMPKYIMPKLPQLKLQKVFPGPRSTFLFLLTSSANSRNKYFVKYSIHPYDNIEQFLTAKLD